VVVSVWPSPQEIVTGYGGAGSALASAKPAFSSSVLPSGPLLGRACTVSGPGGGTAGTTWMGKLPQARLLPSSVTSTSPRKEPGSA
jgi:hypothetical protein